MNWNEYMVPTHVPPVFEYRSPLTGEVIRSNTPFNPVTKIYSQFQPKDYVTLDVKKISNDIENGVIQSDKLICFLRNITIKKYEYNGGEIFDEVYHLYCAIVGQMYMPIAYLIKLPKHVDEAVEMMKDFLVIKRGRV